MKLIEKRLIFSEENAPTRSCHASTVCLLPDGRRIAAWFGGSREGADDVEIYAAVCENGRWSDPVMMSSPSDEACWNPVLFADPQSGVVTLWFKRGRKIAGWRTFVRRSANGGRTWDKERELVPGDLSGGRGPVRAKPILLENGVLLAGASHESPDGAVWRAFVEISRDGGRTFARTPYFETEYPVKLIQPTLFFDPEEARTAGTGIHALLRSAEGHIWRADCLELLPEAGDDGVGMRWSRAYPTPLPNNNSGIDCVMIPEPTDTGLPNSGLPNSGLPNSGLPDRRGRLALLMNPVGSNWGARTPLSLLVSSDGGGHFKRELDLARGEGEYSYPAAVYGNGMLYATCTANRRSVYSFVIEV
ncbi:MAG: exo-alpha-sialidase [Clostridia bacterium]|nr:exo-alpha-sialidase [Clostridia bacterium]